MGQEPGARSLSPEQLIDEYFIENRTKLLDLAAYLDRLDRAQGGPQDDFRMEGLREALRELCSGTCGRVKRIQMIFSDPTTEPKAKLDQKAACGAYDKRTLERR